MNRPSETEIVDRLVVEDLPRGAITRLRVRMLYNAMGQPVLMPIIVVRGADDGPTVGITAAIHGNELNGMRIIHRVLRDLDITELAGTIVAVPVVNIPGFLAYRREFSEGNDLNRIMPGKPNGTTAEIYAHRFLERVVSEFHYLIDLHTASFGRINTLYIRANLLHEETSWMARAQHADILVHNEARDGTLRDAAMERGIPAITVEVGDPQRFQRSMIRFGTVGVSNVLSGLAMISEPEQPQEEEPVVCKSSHWTYTDAGGLLEVFPSLRAQVEAGERIARITDLYGDVVKEYFAEQAGVVVGKSTNPVAQTGARILHMGTVGQPEHHD